jgi:hypothetical protein
MIKIYNKTLKFLKEMFKKTNIFWNKNYKYNQKNTKNSKNYKKWKDIFKINFVDGINKKIWKKAKSFMTN